MSLSSVILARNPVRYLQMQETSGTAATDSSTNAVNGSYAGGVVVNDTTDPAAPPGVGKHVRLDGTNGHIAFDTANFITHTTTGYTVEFWCYLRSPLAQWARLMDFGNSASVSWDFIYEDLGSNRIGLVSGGSAVQPVVTPAPVLGWHHWFWTKSSTGVTTIILDGNQVFQGTFTESANPMQYKYLGRSQYPSDPYLPGSYSQAAIFNSVGSISDARASYVEGIQAGPSVAPNLKTAIGFSGQVDLYAVTNQPSLTTGYEYRVNGGSPVAAPGASMPISVTGLTNGTVYTFEVRATNAYGSSPWSNVVVGSPAATVTLYDSFNRADAAPASGALGTPDIGSAWTAGSGAIGVQSNAAYTTTSQENVYTDVGTSDVDLQYQFATAQPDSSLIWRFKDTSNFWLMTYTGVYRKIAGTYSQIANPPNNSTTFFSNNDVIRVICNGEDMFIFKNGALIYGGKDYHYDPVNSTRVGMRLYSAGIRIDWIHAKPTNTSELAAIVASRGGAPVDLSSLPGGPMLSPVGGMWLYKGRDTAALDAGSVP